MAYLKYPPIQTAMIRVFDISLRFPLFSCPAGGRDLYIYVNIIIVQPHTNRDGEAMFPTGKWGKTAGNAQCRPMPFYF